MLTTRTPWSTRLVLVAAVAIGTACAANDDRTDPSSTVVASTTGGVTSIAATGGVTSIVATGGVTSIAAAGGVTSIAAAGGVTSIVATGGVTSIVATGGVTSIASSASGGSAAQASGGSSPTVGGTTATHVGGSVSKAAGGSSSGTGGTTSRGGSSSQTTGSGGLATGGKATTGTTVASGGAALPPTTDYSAPGPYATTTVSNTGPDGKCTVFRPKTLGENGFLHAPIVFGPGIGMQATQLKDLLLSFASHGFVVVGTGVLNGGPNDAGNRNTMLNALNWILKQNTVAGDYQGKLDVLHAVSMGYSVGGTAAVEVGSHEAVATTVSIHGHIATSALHGPMLQTSGTKDTVGLPMQQQTYDKSQVQTFLGTVSNADHGYIQSNSGGVERPAIIAWLRYWIYNDAGAKHYFWGTDCVLCTAPWTNPQRKNWP